MKPWQLGNTSVRSATRLRDGLVTLQASDREGNLRGVSGDVAWREILGAAGVVSLGDDETNSVGRKWRAALGRLGFIYEDLGSIQEQVGTRDYITPNGHRLIRSETAGAQQECYLRAIAGLWLDVSTARYTVAGNFSPLRHLLRVMTTLDSMTGTTGLTDIEFALFVQTTSDASSPEGIVRNIMQYREQRDRSLNKRRFDNEALAKAAGDEGSVQVSTYRDYMDMNLRYFKSTGLFKAFGRGIAIVPTKRVIVDGLIQDLHAPKSDVEYWKNLTDGCHLPTDDAPLAAKALEGVVLEAKKRGLRVRSALGESVADLQVARLEVEQVLALDDEQKFSLAQREEWEEIAAFMELILNNRRKGSAEGELRIPSSEAPAYFEWTLWRAFLAINSLRNAPQESRRFLIDQDMLPLGCAPGGGPDLVFEFDKFTLVVEVTLTTSIRQEAVEGVPVRSHVYQEARKRPGVPVYCLFVAPTIATPTLQTFRDGKWYADELNGGAADVEIVPIKLQEFRELFIAMFEAGRARPEVVLDVVTKSRAAARQSNDPVHWEQMIDAIVSEAVMELNA